MPNEITVAIGFPNPNGIESISLGLRGTSYPGEAVGENTNPERVASFARTAPVCNPFRVGTFNGDSPRQALSESGQPWAK
ncbi:MAG: hypothetical protein JWQ04_560 [Pedosphaera sp.]|nr:hypothetical protein [Pedosphaera sp.]